MKILSFKEWLNEQAKEKISDEWIILTLDDGTELQSNIKLATQNKYEIAKPDDKVAKQRKIPNKKKITDVLKDLNIDIDFRDEAVKKFISLYPRV